MATTPPPWSSYWPSGVTASQLSSINKSAANFPFLDVSSASSYKSFLRDVQNNPDSLAAKTAAAFGGPEKYKAAADAYNLANLKYTAEKSPSIGTQQRYETAVKNQLESNVAAEQQGLPVAKPSAQIERDARYNTVRSQLENQYNNLVKFDSRLAYQGRSSDLPAIFNQQAAQLADAGVSDISNLLVQDGRLIDSSTGRTVSTSNLGGQVAVDRDTGVQKWGDIFSGVKGGANYGIQTAQDGSVILFPAWEKTKSPIAQIGLGGLESVITPILTIGGAVIGGGPAGSVAGAALGAGVGSTTGQLLASGEVDWEKVALSAAGAGAGQAIFGPGAAEAGSATEAGMVGTPGVSTVYPVAPPSIGVAPLAPQAGAAVGAGTESLLGTGISATPSTSPSVFDPFATGGGYSEITYVEPATSGAAGTIAGLEAPGLSSMGGGTGLLAPVQGGVVSELGFVPTGATPSLGDPASFINNPDYLGSPVISEDYLGLTASDMPTGIGIQDALRMARTGMQLFGGQQQQGLLGGGGTAPYQAQGVDYSGLLSLLQGKARTPGVSPLIAPVVSPVARPYEPLLGQQPQYQSLLGRTQQSLLG